MKKRARERRVNISLDEGDYRAVMDTARVRQRISMKTWIQAAIREKLGRQSTADPFDGLVPADRARVRMCVEVLGAGTDGDVRAALDGLLALAARAAREG